MKLTESGFKFFFRGGITQPPEWAIMPKYWIKRGWKTMAFLSLNDDYGKANSGGLAKTFEANGGKVLGYDWYGLKDTDMYTQLKKIKEMKPDVVSTSGQTEQASLIIRQGKEVWPEIQLVMSGGLDPKRLLELAGSATEGMIFATPEPPATPSTIAFDKKYEGQFKVPVFWGYSKLSYDNVMVLAKAFERAGKVDDPDALREAMLATDYDGLVGHWKFDKTGNSFLPWYYARFEKGKAIVFDPAK
jgi:branched-chain amino acid transport system substrate-binding protein